MKVKIAMALLVGAALMLASPAGATRTESGYGEVTSMSVGVGEGWSVPMSACDPANPSTPNCSPSDTDFLLQIIATNSAPIVVTLDLSPTSFNPDGDSPPDSPFGLLDCAEIFSLDPTGNLAPVCQTGNDGSTCNLSGVADVGGSITLPGSCDVAGNTFYFDLASKSSSISVVAGTAPTPEPSSLALLGIALIPLAIYSRRRAQA
jgi:hypothetical protein